MLKKHEVERETRLGDFPSLIVINFAYLLGSAWGKPGEKNSPYFVLGLEIFFPLCFVLLAAVFFLIFLQLSLSNYFFLF